MDLYGIDKNRKMQLFTICSIFGVGLLSLFFIINIINGNFILMMVDLLLIVIIAIWYVAMYKFKEDLWLYRVGLAALIMAILYAVATASKGEYILYSLFFFPPGIIFFLEKKEGSIWCIALFIVLALLLLQPISINIYQYEQTNALYFLLSFLFVSFISFQLESSRSHYSNLFLEEHSKLQQEKERLEKALEQIKTLTGMLPICASCKKIRDDQGYWNQVEAYIEKHAEVEFTHSICPDCAKKLYPGMS